MQSANDEGAIEKLIALLAAGFGNQLAAMTSRAMAVALFKLAFWIVHGAERIIGAEPAAFECSFQQFINPVRQGYQAAEGSFRPTAACVKQDSVAFSGKGIDPLFDRLSAVATFQ